MWGENLKPVNVYSAIGNLIYMYLWFSNEKWKQLRPKCLYILYFNVSFVWCVMLGRALAFHCHSLLRCFMSGVNAIYTVYTVYLYVLGKNIEIWNLISIVPINKILLELNGFIIWNTLQELNGFVILNACYMQLDNTVINQFDILFACFKICSHVW